MNYIKNELKIINNTRKDDEYFVKKFIFQLIQLKKF